jgi:hypothetical protein
MLWHRTEFWSESERRETEVWLLAMQWDEKHKSDTEWRVRQGEREVNQLCTPEIMQQAPMVQLQALWTYDTVCTEYLYPKFMCSVSEYAQKKQGKKLSCLCNLCTRMSYSY